MKIRATLALLCCIIAFHAVRAQANFPLTASGLKYLITERGGGAQARPGKVIVAHYVGKLLDGTVFDSSRDRNEPMTFTLGKGQVIKGWEEGFLLLHAGDKAVLIVPPHLAYGDKAVGKIPAKATLRFEVEVLEVK